VDVFAEPIATQAGGVVVFDAESFRSNIARSGHAWVNTNSLPGYNGSGYVEALPNTGANVQVSWTNTSPELQFEIEFASVGTHYTWVRGFASNGTDDSVHLGLDGQHAGASNLTWQAATNVWAWSNRTSSAALATVNVPGAGSHIVNLWMREDGSRVDRILLTTNVDFHAVVGQSFHIPGNPEPGIPTMRSPFPEIASNTSVTIFSGNQFQGGGNEGNQLQVGSAIIYRQTTNPVWTAIPMTFYSQSGNNKYFSNAIPASAIRAGDVIQYYLRIPYDDHLPTYLYGNDNLSLKSELETEARNDPFSFTVAWPLQAQGPYLAITSSIPEGELEARIYTESGHLSVLGPDRSGTPLANVVNFAPPRAQAGGERHYLGAVLSSTPLGNGIELLQRVGPTAVTARLTFSEEGVVQYEVTHWGGMAVDDTLITAASDSNEHFFGFGEKFNAVDQAGNGVRIITVDEPGPKGDLAYKVMPWFLSNRGYGFHLDSSAESYFDMRDTTSDRYIVSNLFGSLKFKIVYGPTLTNIMTRFTGYSGRPAMSPPWTFAPWMSSDHWRDGGEVRYVISKLVENGIPGSAFVFDSPWETGYNDFNWNALQFSGGSNYVFNSVTQFWNGFSTIPGMMTFLRTNGYKAVCWMTPFVNTVNTTSDNEPGITNGMTSTYAEGAASNYFVRSSPGGPPLVVGWWKGDGSHVDFTNPDATAWWQKQLSNLVEESGGVIGGFKTDDGEADFIPKTAAYFDGRTGLEMQNGYSSEYHKRVWQVLGTNGILFARSGFTGSQAYPGYWSGDNYPNFGFENGLASVIVAGQSASYCGYSTWGHDIGGYQNGPTSSTPENLFMRWTQFGAFSPLMQMHRQVGTNKQYPWSYGQAGLSNYVFYARLHTALFPYLYTYAKRANDTGLPILRHPALLYPDDTNTFGIRFSYFFGDEFLVAPMTGNVQTSRGIYLPDGVWHDFWTNQSFAGNQAITWSNPDQSKIPVLVRAGAIIPMISSNIMTLCDEDYVSNSLLTTLDSDLEFLVYPHTLSSFTVYDGTEVQAASNETVLTLTYQSDPRSTLFKVRGGLPAGAERDGVRIARFTNQAAFAAAELGWYFDAAQSFVQVRVPHAGGTSVIRFGPDSVGDGLTDSWRLHYFGTGITTNDQSCATCDWDDDGVINQDEYFGGTDPTVASSYLKLVPDFEVIETNQHVQVRWPSQVGLPYRVQYKSQAEDVSAWNDVAGTFIGDGGILTWIDDGTATGAPPSTEPLGRRFYRVLVD